MKKPSSQECTYERNKLMFDILLWLSVIIYVLFLAKVVLFKHVSPFDVFSPHRVYFSEAVNTEPFRTIKAYMRVGLNTSGVYMENVLGNILIFMPMGLLLRLFCVKQKFISTILIVCLSSVGLELFQYIFMLGSTDVDDVILNTLGGFLGVVVYGILSLFVKNRGSMRVLVTTTAVLCAFLVLGAIAIGRI
jgi:glycopeptide antibiotics resistance protein